MTEIVGRSRSIDVLRPMTPHSFEHANGDSSSTTEIDSEEGSGYGAWVAGSLAGLVVGGLGLALGDNTWYRWVRAFPLLGFVLLASEFTLTKSQEIELVKRYAGPKALAAAWLVFMTGVADASGLKN